MGSSLARRQGEFRQLRADRLASWRAGEAPGSPTVTNSRRPIAICNPARDTRGVLIDQWQVLGWGSLAAVSASSTYRMGGCEEASWGETPKAPRSQATWQPGRMDEESYMAPVRLWSFVCVVPAKSLPALYCHMPHTDRYARSCSIEQSNQYPVPDLTASCSSLVLVRPRVTATKRHNRCIDQAKLPGLYYSLSPSNLVSSRALFARLYCECRGYILISCKARAPALEGRRCDLHKYIMAPLSWFSSG